MNRRHYIGIFLLSFATLLLELALTRVLSVALWYHFGFLIISTALLGFGSSGVLLSLWTGLRERAPLDAALGLLSIAFGVTTVTSFWVMQQIPFNPFDRPGGWDQLLFMPAYYLALALPFFCSGLGIALLLTRGSREVNRLYAADLLGAGIGCAALAVVMPTFGGSGAVVLSGALGFLAAGIFCPPRARSLGVAGVALAVLAVGLAFVADRVLPISVAASKEHPLLPPAPRPAAVYTAWNTISRIDVYELPAAPEKGWPGPGLSIVIDGGTAATGMGDLSTGVRDFLATRGDYRTSGLEYVGKEHPKVLILGSGAGREVLEALHFEAASITAVEINPIINDIVSQRMRDRFGGLFEQPEVRLITDEARSFVRRSKETYDVIVSVQTVSNAALASGALSLAENYMYTLEALEDYLDHLTLDGVVLITRGREQIARLFATAREVFEQRGLGSPASHLYAWRSSLMTWGPRQDHTGFLLKKSPWTPDELRSLGERLYAGPADSGFGRNHPPEILYSPLDAKPGSLLHELITAPDLHAVYAAQPIDVSPVSDDRPFFNQQTRWSNLWLGSWTAAGMSPGAESVLVMLLLQSTVISAILILLPLARFSRQGVQVPGRWSFLVYFAGLGLGFIMIEIALLQRFTLFLGQPAYTFALVLGTLLVFTGAGSYVAGYLGGAAPPSIITVILAMLVVLLLTALLTPVAFHAALGLPLPGRLAVAVTMIAPLGFLLGMPFPTGLRLVAAEVPALVPWAWGFFTVIGSVGAMMLGMAFGFKAVLVIAGACYFASLVAVFARRRG